MGDDAFLVAEMMINAADAGAATGADGIDAGGLDAEFVEAGGAACRISCFRSGLSFIRQFQLRKPLALEFYSRILFNHRCSSMSSTPSSASGPYSFSGDIGMSQAPAVLPKRRQRSFQQNGARWRRILPPSTLFVELKPGYAEVRLPFRREVTNHLGSVHAIAMCNAAELVAGTMTDVSIPAGSR